MTSRLNQLRLLEHEYDMKRKTMLQAEHRQSTFDFNYGVLVGQLQQIQGRDQLQGTQGTVKEL